jgi:O-antigen ligase
MSVSLLHQLPAIVIAGCASLSFVLPAQGDVSILAVSWLTGVGFLGVCFWALATQRMHVHDGSTLAKSLAWGWVLAAVVSAVMGIGQFVGWIMTDAAWIAASPHHEAYANLRQRNQLATLLVMGAAILAWRITIKPHAGKLVEWLAMALLMVCLAATASRTGMVQLIGLVFFMAVRRSSSQQSMWPVAGAMLVMYFASQTAVVWASQVLGHSNAGLLSRWGDPNAFSRLALWSNVLELIAQQPWTGHGWRSLAYAHYSTEFSGERFMEMLDNAHNLPLHLAVELGLPLAVAFCGGAAWAVLKAKPWRESRPDRLMAWGILLMIGIHSMVEYPLWYGPFFLTALLCIMILCADLWQKWLLAGTEYAHNAIILGVHGLALGLLAFTAFAAFDYHRVSQIYLQPEDRSSWYADDALGAAKKSVLFKSHAKFAELVITPLSRESAPRVLELSIELIHWSPEPRVIEKLIESSVMMGMDETAAFHLKRYRVAYPPAYAAWAAHSTRAITSGQ